MMAQDCIIVSGLYHSYGTGEGKRDVLKDVNFTLHKGEVVILSGPSGSGKTTLLTIMGALRTPQRGEISVMGHDLKAASADASISLRRKIGFIFQQHNLLNFLTAEENVRMAINENADKTKAEAARNFLKLVGLEDKLFSNVSSLSVGQKQRVSIARALVHNPNLILADEPTASLDWTSAQQVMALFQEKARQEEKSALIVSHDNRLFHYADRVVRILDGGITT